MSGEWRKGEHRHVCPVCEEAWWHPDQPEVECDRVWTLECPDHIGLDKAAA